VQNKGKGRGRQRVGKGKDDVAIFRRCNAFEIKMFKYTPAEQKQ
jgi:hypothetical protein